MTEPLAPSDSTRPEEYLAEVSFEDLKLSPPLLQARPLPPHFPEKT
jgi:hypothetical protein